MSLLAAAGPVLAHDGRIAFSGAVTTATCNVQAADSRHAVSFNQCHASITQVKTSVEVLPSEAHTLQAGGMSKLSNDAAQLILRSHVYLQRGQAQWSDFAETLDKDPGLQGKILVTTEYQ